MTSASPQHAPVRVDPDRHDIARAAGGDNAAFARIVDRHLARVHALAYRALGSVAEAEEVVQDAFLRTWKQLPAWREGEALLSTWLHRVTLNLANDRLRRRREQVPIDDVDLHSHDPQPEHALLAEQREHRLQAALQALPERQRDALLLCHYEGVSNAQAALTLEVSVDALESLLARARRQLRASLADA
ncbi:RNA polymerase sigma factor [Chiayiivirga flava]|uniref:RNA polymerase sigma factor n=1 Tax=Chiayiivirga flava TaxID=659595 RepID=A0A7W8D819_9GAMM|nr:RNA polymerase sigma factor [Chiayiivirga flava]MBB5209614.1 RNA polymerase sigma-70 factor (ECF subfamily) [Chiayiivirga flava]